MVNYDRCIVECAIRIVDKLKKGNFYTNNGEFSKLVKIEIERIKSHCKKAPTKGP